MRRLACLLVLACGCIESEPIAPQDEPPPDEPPALPEVERVWTTRAPVDLAVDEAYVYWLSAWNELTPEGVVAMGAVERWTKHNGEHVVLAATTDGAVPADIAVAGAHVYWTELHGWTSNGRNLGRDQLRRVGKSGGDVQVVAVEQWFEGYTPRPNVVAAGAHVYWASRGTFTEPSGTIARVRDADPLAVVEPIGGGLDEPSGLATDGTHVCFRTGHPNQVSNIWCAPVAGGPILAVAGGRFPYAMLFHDEHLYWSQPSGAAGIERASVSRDPIVERVQPSNRPIHLAADAAAIYWSEDLEIVDRNEIRAWDIGAPDGRLLVESDRSARALAADGEHVYFIEHTSDRVSRVTVQP